jgi:hypothetical protein
MSKKFLDNIKRIKFLMEVKDSTEIDDIELDDEEVNEETELDEEEEVNEEGDETETASTGAGTPGVWASGLTRGKGNPIGNTKWESGLTRSKGNPLK